MINRRTFVGGIAGCLLIATVTAVAQPRKIPVVGFLRTDRPPQSYIDAFEQGLRDRGYTPGQNIVIEYRFADGTTAEMIRLAREVVSLKVDVILAGGGRATQAAQGVTSTIPIVMTSASDPVGTGLVASLAHPGGNTTGHQHRQLGALREAPRAAATGPPERYPCRRPHQPSQSGARRRMERSVGRGSTTGRYAAAHRRRRVRQNSMKPSRPWPRAVPTR